MSLLTTLAKPRYRFSPKHVFGLSLWLAADKITGVADGAAVATWADASGLGRDMTQGTGANQPTFHTGVQNGKPVVRFNGTSHRLENASAFLSGASGSVFAVVKVNPAATPRCVLGSDDHSATTLRFELYVAAAEALGILARDATTVNIIQSNPDNLVTESVFIVLEWHSTGSAYDYRQNGAAFAENVVLGANDGKWASFVTGRDSTVVGARRHTSTGDFFNGDIAELIVYDGVALSAGSAGRVRRHLGRKYGIGVT